MKFDHDFDHSFFTESFIDPTPVETMRSTAFKPGEARLIAEDAVRISDEDMTIIATLAKDERPDRGRLVKRFQDVLQE